MIAGGEKDGDSLEERAKDLAFEPAPPSRSSPLRQKIGVTLVKQWNA